jgi:hypothetical protein
MNPWLAIPTFISCTVWVIMVVYYWIRAKWWKSPTGRNTMGISMFIALSLVRISYTHLDETPPADLPFWMIVIGTVTYSGLGYFGVRRLMLVRDAQREKAREIAEGIPRRRWNDPK